MQNFIISTESISWGKEDAQNTLAVRGLSFQDFTILFSTYGKAVDDIFKFVEQAQSNEKADFDAKAFGVELITQAPQAVASLIALAADIPDQSEQMARMPFPVQIRLLEAIYRLTIEEAGGLNDFLALVVRIARGVRQTVVSMNSHQTQNPDLKSTGT